MLSRSMIHAILLLAMLATAEGAPVRRHADSGRGKFIPTYAIIYGNAQGRRSAEETARFDLLISSFNAWYARLWAAEGRNSWRNLKALNPNMVIVAYAMGPGEYNTAEWGQLGEGWEWLKQNHGNDAEDRWTARGIRHGTYLQGRDYPNERLMDISKQNWQEYWPRAVYQGYWGGGKGVDVDGVDGVFSDNTSYTVPWYGRWYREGSPEMPDHPAEYFEDGKYLHDRWREHLNAFFGRAIPFFAGRSVTYTVNFGNLGAHPEWWRELDALPAPPFAAMDESGFVCPYGSGPAWYKTWDWEKKVRGMRALRNVRVLMNAHATVPQGQGLEKMDVPDPTGTTGWDALWFAMTSFLMGYDDVARNGYMNFTVWSYSGYYWFEEFDPRYLHLGKAAGEFYRAGQVWFREFEDGFVAVNPGTQDAAGVQAPAANVRVLHHGNFRRAEDVEPVSRFDLPAKRGVILLKQGRKAGNEDNAEK